MDANTQFSNMRLCVGELEVGGKSLAPSATPTSPPEIPTGKVSAAQVRDALQDVVDAMTAAGIFTGET